MLVLERITCWLQLGGQFCSHGHVKFIAAEQPRSAGSMKPSLARKV